MRAKLRRKLNILCVLTCALLLQSNPASSETIINNSNTAPQSASGCSSQSSNYVPDSRIPPAGVYSTQTGNGSSQTVYSTGEARPYAADTNCNNSSPTPQANVWVPAPPRK